MNQTSPRRDNIRIVIYKKRVKYSYEDVNLVKRQGNY